MFEAKDKMRCSSRQQAKAEVEGKASVSVPKLYQQVDGFHGKKENNRGIREHPWQQYTAQILGCSAVF